RGFVSWAGVVTVSTPGINLPNTCAGLAPRWSEALTGAGSLRHSAFTPVVQVARNGEESTALG
ncbi:MAG: hypothetical protein NZL87_09900, partial [Thermomicrobium sp.]|nr:hypothetical protein [Thermomicrobium sp.]